MRFISWNVNGLRACMNKGFMEVFRSMDADFFCLQETKLQEGQIQLDLPGYHQYWCYAQKKGYSGTAIFTRHEPMSVSYGLGIEELDTEGRLICLEYPEFYLVTCYTPNAQRGLARIDHRLRWEEAFRDYLMKLDSVKPVVICGDLNVAHKEIDLKNPSSNRGNAGFSDQERSAFSTLLDSGFTDTFRHLYPNKTGAYSWWSYMYNARQNNAGWRIDYFLVSDRLKEQIYAADIHPEVMGSDHCPVSLDLDTTCNGGLHIPVPEQSDTAETKEADGDAPIGSVHLMKTLAAVTVLALLLAIPIFLLSGRETTQDATRPTKKQVISSQTMPGRLIDQVYDRTGILEYREMLPSVTSSTFYQYLVCGETYWRLDGHEIDSAYSAKLVSPINFHVQVVFDPDYPFHSGDKPEVMVMLDDATSEGAKIQTIRYYWEDDRIAGCFISGFAQAPLPLELRVSYDALTEVYGPITVTPSDGGDLVTEQVAYGSELILETNLSYLSSTIPHTWFVCGEERWRMLRSENEPYLWYEGTPSFSLRLEFSKTAQFTADLKPTVTASVMVFPGPTDCEDLQINVHYYVDENDRVAGAFVYGYLSADATLSLTVEHNSYKYNDTLDIEADFTDMSAEALAVRLATSRELSYYIDRGGDYLDELLSESPALQELLSRPYAIDNMLRVNAYTSKGSNFDALLSLDYFQSQMTEAEKLMFQSQQERGILYGDVIIAVPT